ncbi:hypothetical protein [Endozoicomonas sp. Mp262]|uniref:hypothetical protein n=1 Tax=Endozoicomonas sp. Mp262 TaxID=2919499 RepID=UPI0021D8E040
MNFAELTSVLTADGQGNITLSKGSLTANVDDLISACYLNIYNNNQAEIVIRNVSVVVNKETIEVTGTSEFLKTSIATTGAALPVKGVFSVDDQGDVQFVLKYTLLDDPEFVS